MKLSQLGAVLALALAWAACSGVPTSDPTPTSNPGVTEGATAEEALSTPSSTCKAKTDTSGAFQEFKTSLTRRIKRPKLSDKVVTVDVTQTERWLWGTTREDKVVVQYNGKPLRQTSVNRYSTAGDINISQNYFPPYTGVSLAVASISNGTMYALVDGRSIGPVPANIPASSIPYDDGLPGPTVTLDPDVQSTMNELLSATKTAASKCLGTDTNIPSSDLIASPPVGAHQTDTRNNLACQGCRGTCMVAAGTCFYAAATSIACGPFVFFCAVGEIVACTGLELGCLSVCDNPNTGGFCCPVGCGGEGKPNFISPPPPGSSVGCCAKGETCSDRNNGLCCSPGTTACGSNCCGSGQACAADGSGGGTCCDAGAVTCGGQCCAVGKLCGNVDGFPTCCTGCTTTADCGPGGSGSVNECVRGCCVNIPG